MYTSSSLLSIVTQAGTLMTGVDNGLFYYLLGVIIAIFLGWAILAYVTKLLHHKS